MSVNVDPNSSSTSREIDQRLVELQSLFEMSQVLNSSLNISSVLNNILLTPMGRMMISRGFVMVVDEEGSFNVEALKGLDRDLLGKKFYFEYECSKPTLINNIQENDCSQKELFKEHQIELVLPILSTNRTLGFLCLGQKLGGLQFSDSEIDFLSSLSNIAATSIENALMYRKLEKVNRRLDKKVQELKTLFEIGQELNSSLEKERIINLLVYAIMGEMLVNRIFIFIENENHLELIPTKGSLTKDSEIKKLAGKGVQKALSKLTSPFIVENESLIKNLEVLRKLDIHVVIPMITQDKTRGVILLGEKINKNHYVQDEVDFLSTLSNQAIISIENARLFEETLEKQRMEEELNIARDIQRRLLPSTYPPTDGFEIKGLNIPSRQVGGDYFDCIKIDENRIALTVADVSGKGVPASLLMSNLQASLHSHVSAGTGIVEITGRLNDFLHAHTSYDKFITYFYAELDVVAKTLTYVNAGHNPPYLYSADGTCKLLDKGGLLLGMMPNMPYESETVPLKQGDLVFMFTDGVTEAKSAKDVDFEEWRLEELLANSLSDDLNTLLDKIILAINEFSINVPQADDITLLAMRVLK
jgi:phosphoserine phosphatase RsbU/P